MKKAVISTFIIILCISVYASSAIRKSEDDRICNELSKTVYNIVNESYVNYGNIKNSKYKDIISPEDYSKMNYLGITNLNDPDSQNIKRSEIDIKDDSGDDGDFNDDDFEDSNNEEENSSKSKKGKKVA